jgi:subtilisin family serine protease
VKAFVVGIATVLLWGLAAAASHAAPGPPDHPEWWFDTWHVPALWAGGARGQGIVIGEIDTGVNASLPELSGNVLSGTDFGSFGGDGRTDRDNDEFGHGTAMASLMVAHSGLDNILGIAPDAKVLPIAVPITGTTDDAGNNAGDDLLHAIRWAADHGAKIITMSLGAPKGPKDTGRSCPADEQSTIDYALSKGAIVVASGGNSGDNGSPVEEPSVCLGVISVGAVDESGSVPDWSSKHPYLTVTAPGAGVPSIGRVPGQAYFGDGTSQAAAITSGGLAVIWSKYPALTGRQVVARLLATLDSHRTTRDPAGGYGLINIGAAVNASVPTDAANPVFAAADPFLAQDKASANVPPDPKVRPAASRKTLPGGFAVSPVPNPLTSGPGLAGLIGAGVGVLSVALLLTGAARRRRAVALAPTGTFTTADPGAAREHAAPEAPGDHD